MPSFGLGNENTSTAGSIDTSFSSFGKINSSLLLLSPQLISGKSTIPKAKLYKHRNKKIIFSFYLLLSFFIFNIPHFI